MASKIPAGKYKKIFLSRLKLQRNPLFNEQAEGNVNFVPYRALLKFHQEWALRNPYQRVDITFDELHYCQSKIKTKLPKTVKGILFQILACFTFGQLRKHLRHKSKSI